jgi:hypothetical protein
VGNQDKQKFRIRAGERGGKLLQGVLSFYKPPLGKAGVMNARRIGRYSDNLWMLGVNAYV